MICLFAITANETQQVNFHSIIILMLMLLLMMIMMTTMLMIFESYEKCYDTTIETARAHAHNCVMCVRVCVHDSTLRSFRLIYGIVRIKSCTHTVW